MTSEEELFGFLDDLEQHAEALYAADRAPEVADRSRAEYQQVSLAARLMASVGASLTCEVRGVGRVSGTLERVATGWCLLTAPTQTWVIQVDALVAIEGASDRAVPEVAWSPITRLGLGSALRALAQSGERCILHSVDGAQHEGLLRRVGSDFVEVVVGSDGPGREVLVALPTLAAVRHRAER